MECTVIGVCQYPVLLSLLQAFAHALWNYVQALFSFLYRAVVWTCDLGNARTCNEGSRLLGLSAGIGFHCHVAWVKAWSQRVEVHCTFAVCKRHGGKYVPGFMVVDDLCDRNGGCQLYDQTKTRIRIGGLVRGCTEIPSEGDIPFYKRPIVWATCHLYRICCTQ